MKRFILALLILSLLPFGLAAITSCNSSSGSVLLNQENTITVKATGNGGCSVLFMNAGEAAEAVTIPPDNCLAGTALLVTLYDKNGLVDVYCKNDQTDGSNITTYTEHTSYTISGSGQTLIGTEQSKDWLLYNNTNDRINAFCRYTDSYGSEVAGATVNFNFNYTGSPRTEDIFTTTKGYQLSFTTEDFIFPKMVSNDFRVRNLWASLTGHATTELNTTYYFDNSSVGGVGCDTSTLGYLLSDSVGVSGSFCIKADVTNAGFSQKHLVALLNMTSGAHWIVWQAGEQILLRNVAEITGVTGVVGGDKGVGGAYRAADMVLLHIMNEGYQVSNTYLIYATAQNNTNNFTVSWITLNQSHATALLQYSSGSNFIDVGNTASAGYNNVIQYHEGMNTSTFNNYFFRLRGKYLSNPELQVNTSVSPYTSVFNSSYLYLEGSLNGTAIEWQCNASKSGYVSQTGQPHTFTITDHGECSGTQIRCDNSTGTTQVQICDNQIYEYYYSCEFGACQNSTSCVDHQPIAVTTGTSSTSPQDAMFIASGMIGFLLTPSFWAMILSIIAGIVAAKYGSPEMGIISFAGVLAFFGIVGWAPIWITIVIVLIAAGIFASGFRKAAKGG